MLKYYQVINLKIISGKYKGRILKGFDIDGTRPTMDRVKESLFAMIQDYIKDAVVLDLYSGSGNLAIEALSNGAKQAYMVDNNKKAINVINDNIKMLKIDNTNIVNLNAKDALSNFIKDKIIFDIIFLDPPYYTEELDSSLSKINDNINILSDNGIVICETELDVNYSKYNNLVIFKTRTYGKKHVNILKTKK